MKIEICSTDGCERQRTGVYHSFCTPCYKRDLRKRQKERFALGYGRKCSVEGCENLHEANGVCSKHRLRKLRADKPKKAPAPKSICAVEDCEKVSMSAGYCSGHYSNKRRHGDPIHPSPRGGTMLERFARRVVADDDLGCWLWTGTVNKDGYGKFYVGDRREEKAHRWFYREMTGRELTRAVQLDHDCNVRNCVRPAHLAEVGQAEHNRRTAARLAAEAQGLRYIPNQKAKSMAEIGFAITNRLPMAWNT